MNQLMLLTILLFMPLQNPPLQQQEVGKPTHHDSDPKVVNNLPGSTIIMEVQGKPLEPPPTKDKDKSGNDYERWGLIVNFVMALATIFLAVYAAMQAKASREAAEAARISAEMARQSTEFAQQAVKSSERGDVLLESSEIIIFAQKMYLGWLTLRFKNFGRTRANDVSFDSQIIVYETPNITIPCPAIPFLVMGAGQKTSVSFKPFKDSLAFKTFDEIINGSIPMRFVASVVYMDVFGDSHLTRIVAVFDPKTSAFKIEECTAG